MSLMSRKLLSLDIFPAFVLSAIFLAGAVFWTLFSLAASERAEDYFRFAVERLADQLLRSQMMSRLSADNFPENVLGFGIFDAQGQALVRWGDTPANLSIPRHEFGHNYTAWKHLQGDKFDFIKVLTPFGEGEQLGPPPRDFRHDERRDHDRMLGWRDGQPFRPQMSREMHSWSHDSFVYLRLRQPHFEAGQLARLLGLLAGPLIWGGVLFWVGFLWYRSRRYERDLDKSREVLSFAEAARTLSHEIRNPLSAILLQTALLDNSREEVRIIEEETRRISRLVERVRDFLRDAKGRPEPQNVWKALSDLGNRFSAPLKLVPETDPGWNVGFDEMRFRSVLENLLKNAHESGPSPEVEAHVSQFKPGWVRVEILDRGEGLNTEAQKRAFTPFFTTKIQGSGIGLAVSRRFTEVAGGKLRLENRPDGGARAILEIPEYRGAL